MGRERKPESMIPMLISWLTDACKRPEGDVVYIDRTILEKAVVVGRIVAVHTESTKNKITIDDGTGVLSFQVNKKYDEHYSQTLKEIDMKAKNIYVKVVLVVTTYKNECVFAPIKVTPIANLNYLAYHFLNSLQAQKVRLEGFSNFPTAEIRYPNKNGSVAGDHSPNHRPPAALPSYPQPIDIEDEAESEKHIRGVIDAIRFLRKKNNKSVALNEIVEFLQGKESRDTIQLIIRRLHENSDIRKIGGQEVYELNN